jgi:4-amino-4-deoxy-L-arabinose transferase-like glycosyltransferase
LLVLDEGRHEEAGPSDAVDQRRFLIALALILGAAFVLRFVVLGQFPDVQADEGLWTHGSKNRLLFGDWFLDGRAHFFLSPVYHALSLLSFGVFGPSIASARLVSALAGVVTVGLTALLALRLTGNRPVALLAGIVVAIDPWAVITSRQAMTESVLLAFVLGSAVFLTGRKRTDLALAGVLFALAILTKLNALSLGLAFGGYLLVRPPDDDTTARPGKRWRNNLVDGVLFGAVALGLAAAGYWLVSRIDPGRFVDVFARELGGAHAGSGREEASVFGRWGPNPVVAGRSLLEVVRANPFLFCLGALGGVVAWGQQMRGRLLLLLWLAVAFGFPLTQIYQPVRYFYPVVPPLAVLVAVLLVTLSSLSGGRRTLVAAVGVVVAFNLAYLSTNFLANRGSRAVAVAEWVRQHTDPSDPVLVAAHFATDLPNRAYSYDLVAPDPSTLDRAVLDLGIRYVIWDDAEWSAAMREALAARYTEVHRWDFASVFRVGDP